ncbi:MAG: right-handed parallel beta-helix repeat-containing protein, partial [Gammaproteobacteria bacterium]
MSPITFNILSRLLMIVALTLGLAACGGGGSSDGGTPGVGTVSFTVSTSAVTNGAISPSSISVNENSSTSFTVTPDAGFLIDAISGCGGSLVGNIYTTGAVTADCTVTVSFIARVIQTLNPVTEMFSNAAKWNDYAPGSQWSTATNTACTAASDSACIHGGEHRMVLVTGKTECTGLSATDALGAFNWVCDNSIGTARMISTGLADGKYLSDLIDFTTPGFKANAVTVSDSIGVWGVTPSTAWWSNPVVVNNAGGNLSATDSTIYLVTSDPGITWGLLEDKLALVAQPGVTLTASGGISSSVVRSSTSDDLWFEGNIDATGKSEGVSLLVVRFSVLNNVIANNTDIGGGTAGVYFEVASKNRLIDVTASNNGTNGIRLAITSIFNKFTNVTASNNGSNGIFLDNTSNNILSGIVASNNSDSGIRLNSASFNSLQDLTVNNNGSSGVDIATSNNNILSGVMASNNIDGIFLTNSSSNILTDVTTSNNNFYGIGFAISSSNNQVLVMIASNNGSTGVNVNNSLNNTLAGVTVNSNASTGIRLINAANSNTVTGVTASNNGSHGVLFESSSNNTLLNVAASNNSSSGIRLQSSFNTLSDLAISHNDIGVSLNGASNNTFTGWLEVGNNST